MKFHAVITRGVHLKFRGYYSYQEASKNMRAIGLPLLDAESRVFFDKMKQQVLESPEQFEERRDKWLEAEVAKKQGAAPIL